METGNNIDLREVAAALQAIAADSSQPLSPEREELLRGTAERFPYWPLPALLLLRLSSALSGAERSAIQQKLAVMCADPRTLAYAAHGSEWADFYPAESPADPKQTDDVIDTFLRTYGNSTPQEEALLERMIFNPTPDYAEMLAREEQVNLPDPADDPDPDSPEARINAFIRSQHPAAPLPPEEPETEPDNQEPAPPIPRPEHPDDSLLSESLAKIFIKQGRYERAYEIISGLNLKFPKKSAYFADQLRFLQKLIINQRRIEALKGDSAQEHR